MSPSQAQVYSSLGPAKRSSSCPACPAHVTDAAMPVLPLALSTDTVILVISFLKPRDVAALSSTCVEFRALRLMSHIQVVSGKFRAADQVLSHLHHLRRLQCLDLRGNRLTPENIRALTSLVERSPHLERLDLSGMSMSSSTIRHLARTLQRGHSIKALSLSVNNVGDDGAEALGSLCASGAVPDLEVVNLGNCVIGPSGVEHLARGLQQCPRLRLLNLSNNPLGSNVRGLASCLGPRLESLSIFNALLDPLAVDHLVSQWRCLATLHTLNLSWNRIGTAGAKALARCLSGGSCLTSLNLAHNYIQGDALPALSLALRTGLRASIRKLNLGWNPLNMSRAITPPSMAALTALPPSHQQPVAPALLLDSVCMNGPFLRLLACALADCPALEAVNLSNVDLGPEGAACLTSGLKEGPAGPALRSLSISWNRMGPQGAASFAGLLSSSPSALPVLSVLDLAYNVIGDEGAAALARLPSSRGDLVLHLVGNCLSGCSAHHMPVKALASALRLPSTAAAMATDAAPGLSRAQSDSNVQGPGGSASSAAACPPSSTTLLHRTVGVDVGMDGGITATLTRRSSTSTGSSSKRRRSI